MGEIRFGVAGCPPNFWKSSYGQDSTNNPLWLASIGLDAYEVQFTHGIRITKEKALLVREHSEEKGISLSLHAPYFVVLTSLEERVVKNSIELMIKCVEFASYLGSKKVILHPGPYRGDAQEAFKRCMKNLEVIKRNTSKEDIFIYPETVGRKDFLGSLEEVIRMCKALDILRPCIDFAHLYAREGGSPSKAEDFRRIFDYVGEELGFDTLKGLHCHFYPVEFDRRGERCHRNFKEGLYGPRFEPFLETVLDYGIVPTIICESKEAQDEDALLMKTYYHALLEKKKAGSRTI